MNIEQRKQRLKTIAMWGLGIGAAVLISPIIFLAVKGIVGVMIAGVLGLALVNFAPVVANTFANWKVKGIKAEAARNPIETMENLFIAKQQALKLAEDQVTKKVGAKNTFARQVQEFSRQFPDRAREFQEKLELMTASCDKSIKDLERARVALTQAEQKLVELRAYWKMTQATLIANKAMDMDLGDVYAKMKEDTACDAVFEQMDAAFADLEVDVASSSSPLAKDLMPEDILRKSGFYSNPEHVHLTASNKEIAK